MVLDGLERVLDLPLRQAEDDDRNDILWRAMLQPRNEARLVGSDSRLLRSRRKYLAG